MIILFSIQQIEWLYMVIFHPEFLYVWTSSWLSSLFVTMLVMYCKHNMYLSDCITGFDSFEIHVLLRNIALTGAMLRIHGEQSDNNFYVQNTILVIITVLCFPCCFLVTLIYGYLIMRIRIA